MSDDKQAVDKQALTKRPRYFDGQYLNVDDFTSEQQYHIDRQRRLGRCLHISGVLEGLVATVEGTSIKIASGSAIDPQGQQILLLEPISLLETEINLALSASPAKDHLVLTYTEEKADEQVSGNADSATRWHEKATAVWMTEDEAKKADGVRLAKVSKNAGQFVVDRTVCQYSGVYLPSDGAGQGAILRSGGTTNPNLAILTGSLSVTGNLTVAGTSTLNGSLTVKNAVFLKGSENGTGLTVDANDKVGIDTTNPVSKLTVNLYSSAQFVDNNFSTYGDAPLTIFEPTPNGGTTPNSTRDILNLVRAGVNNQSWGNKVTLAIGRYASSVTTADDHGTDSSRTQLDIKLTANNFNRHQTVLSLRSNGNVGIGTTNPSEKLEISGNLKATSATLTGNISVTGTSTLNGSLTVNSPVHL